MKFYRCMRCGNQIEMIHDAGPNPICCGADMREMIPGTSDGAAEKHVPAVSVDGNRVSVQIGETIHPMMEAHYIEWILIETKKGTQRRNLAPSDEPKASFLLEADDELVAVYAYCNLHGLWESRSW